MTSKIHSPSCSRVKRACPRSQNSKHQKSIYTNEEAHPSEDFQHPSSNKSGQQRKMVTFSKYVDEYDTIHIKDFLLHEHKAYWYRNDELESIQIEIGATILAMTRHRPTTCKGIINPRRNQKLFAKGFLCTRGLEGFRPKIFAGKTKHIHQVWDTVLDEQHKQWSKGKNYNPNAIAYACRKLTRRSVAVARLRAISDERDCLEEKPCLEKQQQRKLTVDNNNSTKLVSTVDQNKIHRPQQHNDSGVMSLLQQHAAQNNNKFMKRRRRPRTTSSRAA